MGQTLFPFRKFDKLIVEMAMKCGGVLSPLHLIKELDITIEDAVDLLERFVKLEEEELVFEFEDFAGITHRLSAIRDQELINKICYFIVLS